MKNRNIINRLQGKGFQRACVYEDIDGIEEYLEKKFSDFDPAKSEKNKNKIKDLLSAYALKNNTNA